MESGSTFLEGCGDLDGAFQASGHRTPLDVGRHHAGDLLPLLVADLQSAVADVDAPDDQHFAVEFDLAGCVPDQTGRVDSPCLQGAGERSGQSARRRGDDVVERGGVTVGRHPVVFGNRPVDSVEDGLLFLRQVGGPNLPLLRLDPNLGAIDHIGHPNPLSVSVDIPAADPIPAQTLSLGKPAVILAVCALARRRVFG